MRTSEELDEILQAAFCLEEERGGPFSHDEVLARARCGAEVLKRAVDSELMAEGESGYMLTDDGRARASLIVRRHRLAERLLHDVLRVPDAATESVACRFEHVLEHEVTESICTLLGHPRACPHGKAIPPGECCVSRETEIPAVIQKLSDLIAGAEGRVAYVHAANDSRIDRLASFGLLPGTPLRVHQTWPSLVLEVGETHLALDRETAEDIFVRVGSSDTNAAAGSGTGRRRRRGRGPGGMCRGFWRKG